MPPPSGGNPDDPKPGCLLARLRPADQARFYQAVNELVPEADLNVEEGGAERDSHVSALFGFDPKLDPARVREFLADQQPVYLTLGAIGNFPKPDGAVLIVHVESRGLEALHYALREHFKGAVKVTFDDYHAHLTLAYTRPGAACVAKLDGSTKFAGETYYFTELVYSYGTSAVRRAEIMPLGHLGESVRRVLGGQLGHELDQPRHRSLPALRRHLYA
jgi:2'-5' RNA ligase superfamily